MHVNPLDIIFPKRCVVCGEKGYYLCSSCYSAIDCFEGLCLKCGSFLKSGFFHGCGLCIAEEFPFNGVVAMYPYDSVKRILYSFKYTASVAAHRAMELLVEKALGRMDVFADIFKGCDVIVPVPMHWRKRLVREFNHAEVFSKLISEATGIPTANLLKRVKNVKSQVGLPRRERLRNQEGSFKAEGVKGLNVVLVDDVATTLSTLREASRVLKDRGTASIWCVVFARAQLGKGLESI